MVDEVRERERERKKWWRLCSDNWRLKDVAWNCAQTSLFTFTFSPTHPTKHLIPSQIQFQIPIKTNLSSIHTVSELGFVPFRNMMLNFGRLWTSHTLIGLGLGQFLSLLITSTGFTSSELAKKGFLHLFFFFFSPLMFKPLIQ